ncbi:hypothetical protein ES707_12367 [subsurface metagenome]
MIETKLDPKEEREYAELRKLAQKLHIPIPEAFLTLEVFDKDGRVIQRHRQRSHSWVRNAYNLMFSQLAGKDIDDAAVFGAGKLNYKVTDGTIKQTDRCGGTSNPVDSLTSGYRAAAADDERGILVGYGTAAESFEDYVLEHLLIEGTTDDGHHLSFVESEAHSITWTAGTLTLKNDLVRYFNNNEATQSVDVEEVALVWYAIAGLTPLYVLFTRDKLASTVTIPITGQLKVTYTISLTYPE